MSSNANDSSSQSPKKVELDKGADRCDSGCPDLFSESQASSSLPSKTSFEQKQLNFKQTLLKASEFGARSSSSGISSKWETSWRDLGDQRTEVAPDHQQGASTESPLRSINFGQKSSSTCRRNDYVLDCPFLDNLTETSTTNRKLLLTIDSDSPLRNPYSGGPGGSVCHHTGESAEGSSSLGHTTNGSNYGVNNNASQQLSSNHVGMTGGIGRESSDMTSPTYLGSSSGGCTGPLMETTTTTTTSHCWYRPQLNGIPPSARAAHSADVIGTNQIFLFGGWNGKKAMNDLYVLDTDKLKWTSLKTKNQPPERNNHTTAVVGHRLYTHGGHDGNKWLDDLHVLDVQTLIWTELHLNGKAPSARACHTVSRVHDKLYLFGGYDGSRCFNDLDILDIDTLAWIQPKVCGMQPLARNAHSMTVIETKLFLFGGHSGSKHLTDLHIFDTLTLKWSQPDITGSPPPGLRGHSATLIGDRVFLFGGYDGKGRSNNLHVFESTKLKWIHQQETEGAPIGRQRHSACLVGPKRLFVFGGFDGTKWLNDMHILDIGRLTEDELTDTAARKLISNLSKLVGDSEFSDVILCVEGRDIPAHRCILASQCDYFHSMFTNHMKESFSQKIVINGWSWSSFMVMLEFIYTGRLSETNPSIVCDVLGLADSCGLDGLKSLCENMLKHSVDHENVCALLKSADKYQAFGLKRFCCHYIYKHASEVMRTSSFEELASTPWLLMEITKLTLKQTHKGFRSFSSSEDNHENNNNNNK